VNRDFPVWCAGGKGPFSPGRSFGFFCPGGGGWNEGARDPLEGKFLGGWGPRLEKFSLVGELAWGGPGLSSGSGGRTGNKKKKTREGSKKGGFARPIGRVPGGGASFRFPPAGSMGGGNGPLGLRKIFQAGVQRLKSPGTGALSSSIPGCGGLGPGLGPPVPHVRGFPVRSRQGFGDPWGRRFRAIFLVTERDRGKKKLPNEPQGAPAGGPRDPGRAGFVPRGKKPISGGAGRGGMEGELGWMGRGPASGPRGTPGGPGPGADRVPSFAPGVLGGSPGSWGKPRFGGCFRSRGSHLGPENIAGKLAGGRAWGGSTWDGGQREKPLQVFREIFPGGPPKTRELLFRGPGLGPRGGSLGRGGPWVPARGWKKTESWAGFCFCFLGAPGGIRPRGRPRETGRTQPPPIFPIGICVRGGQRSGFGHGRLFRLAEPWAPPGANTS